MTGFQLPLVGDSLGTHNSLSLVPINRGSHSSREPWCSRRNLSPQDVIPVERFPELFGESYYGVICRKKFHALAFNHLISDLNPSLCIAVIFKTDDSNTVG